MSLAGQTAAIAVTSLRGIPQRLGTVSVIVVGMAGVVGVLLPVLAMYSSFRATIQADGRVDRAIVLSRDATTEYDSGLSRKTVADISSAAGVRHDARDDALVSAEVVLVAPVSRKRDGTDVNITLRGVGEQYFAIRPELTLQSGRMFRPGNQELLVGAAAQAQFAGLELGDRVRLQDGDWTVVGTFGGGSGSRDSEVIADAQTVMSAYKLAAFNSVTVALESASAFATFRDAVVRDLALPAYAATEPTYLASASSSVNRMLRLVVYAIGSIMALGALFGALSSMSSAVAARSVEMATLRAIGFGATPVAVAVLIEALLLALMGAAIGIGVSYAAFNGAMISTLGGALWDSQLVYSLAFTPELVLAATALACSLGLAGGLLPAIRAARANIAGSLHES
jgi:putative ABC transport system permease protein